MAHAYIDINDDGTPEDVTAMVQLTAFITAAWSAGAVAATASDLATWIRAYARGEVARGPLFEDMTRWVDRGDGSYYGMGLIKKQHGDRTILGHRGASAGFSASAWHAPDVNITVVVLTNGHLKDVDPIAFALFDAAVRAR
jgi:CubicO group peptidase (beta-lactamase class C family)